LRTINGGICCGLTFVPRVLTQLLLLGYQWIVNSLGCKDILCFLNLANIISTSFVSKSCKSFTLLSSVNSRGDFRQLSPKGQGGSADPQ
jgi:hypothetical protein